MPSSDLRPPAGLAELRSRLTWLTFFRLAVVIVLLASTFLSIEGDGVFPEDSQRQLLQASLFGFLATLATALALRADWHLLGLAYAQVFVDVAIAGWLVLASGVSSTFSFMFLLAVANSALLLFERGAVLAASLSSIVFFGLRLAALQGRLKEPGVGQEAPGPFFFSVFVNVGAFFLLAALASYFADLLRAKGEELRAREQDYADLAGLQQVVLENIPSGIATVATSGKLIYVNRAGLDICAPWLGEKLPGRLEELIPSLSVESLITRQRQEIQVKRPEQSHVLGLTATPLSWEVEQGWVVVFQDLTELRALEADARRNERLVSVGRMAAGLAHEIRNPLAGISGAVQMLAEGGSTASDDDRRLAQIVKSESERLDRLVTEFLVFARPPQAHRVWQDLRVTLEPAMEMARLATTFSGIRIHLEANEAGCMHDPDLIRQVTWNLMLNAAQAQPKGGDIWITLGVSGNQAFLRIDDAGPGVPMDQRSQVFDPFFTTRAQGTGLGLATVQSIIQAHGGEVTVGEASKGGARFEVTLSRVRPPVVEPAAQLPSAPISEATT